MKGAKPHFQLGPLSEVLTIAKLLKSHKHDVNLAQNLSLGIVKLKYVLVITTTPTVNNKVIPYRILNTELLNSKY